MACFVAFRYPDQSAYFLEDSDTEEVSFHFISFTKKRKAINGSLEEYHEQLIGKNIPGSINNHIAKKDEFLHQAQQLKDFFQNTNTYKVVLSRIQAEKATSIRLHDIFEALCSAYTKELVYVACIDDSVWCGATPEVLASISTDKIKTVALASTKLVKEEREWTAKEILEHRYVEDFYFQLAEKNQVEILSKSETQDVRTGELLHLKSSFCFSVQKDFQSHFIEQLHPTPAVCGLPQQDAFTQIKNIEKHHRNWYTGYLGLHTKQTSKYYVNLRCMQLGTNATYIYVGGGHTIDSDAEAEWQETVNKSFAMQRILNTVT